MMDFHDQDQMLVVKWTHSMLGLVALEGAGKAKTSLEFFTMTKACVDFDVALIFIRQFSPTYIIIDNNIA